MMPVHLPGGSNGSGSTASSSSNSSGRVGGGGGGGGGGGKMLRQRAAMTTFVSEASEFSHAGDETNFFEPAPHFIAMPDPGVAPRSIADRRRGLDASARSGSSCDGLRDVSGTKGQRIASQRSGK